MDIFHEVSDIFKDVLDNDKLQITRETSAADVEEWDSLNHIQLVVAIEKYFKLKFSAQEIRNWKNVGEMCDSISGKLPKG
jgi:acyl carrier protein